VAREKVVGQEQSDSQCFPGNDIFLIGAVKKASKSYYKAAAQPNLPLKFGSIHFCSKKVKGRRNESKT
jgi:hypothetical protein